MIIINSHHSSQKSKAKIKPVYFSRQELATILNIYSKNIAAGEWRDYALDHVENSAIFSIYRSSFELPLYTIEKKRVKGKGNFLFILQNRQKKLWQAAQLQDIVIQLNKLPKLVKTS